MIAVQFAWMKTEGITSFRMQSRKMTARMILEISSIFLLFLNDRTARTKRSGFTNRMFSLNHVTSWLEKKIRKKRNDPRIPRTTSMTPL